MTNVRAVISLAFVLAAVAFGPAISPVRAGAGCTLTISSDSSPAAAESATILVGEGVDLEGTFAPNAEVRITFVRNDSLFWPRIEEPITETAEADGTLSVVHSFVPRETGIWEIRASVEEACEATVSATVVPDGPYATVSVRTYLCPPEIQSVADLETAGESACDIGLNEGTENLPDVPDGYEDNIFVTSTGIGWDLIASDGSVHGSLFDTAVLLSGECNPTALACTYDFTYDHPFTPVGTTQLDLFDTLGHRLGHVTFSTIAEPSQPVEFVDLGIVKQGYLFEFELTEGDGVRATVFHFADPLPAPTPTPDPNPGGGASTGGGPTLPDTAVAAPRSAQPITWLLIIVAGALIGRGGRRAMSARRLRG